MRLWSRIKGVCRGVYYRNLQFVQVSYSASTLDAPSLQLMHLLCLRRTILTKSV